MAGYMHPGRGSVLLDFGAGLIWHEATVDHDVVECPEDVLGQVGAGELCTAGTFILAKCDSCLLYVSPVFYDHVFV